MPNRRHSLLSGLFLVLMFLVGVSRVNAAPRDLTAYPLKVHIYQNHWSGGDCCGYKGYGRGNVIEGTEIHGMEYTFNCLDRFMASDADENFPAKWKKPGQKLEMVMGVIGQPGKTHTCDLEVTLKDSVFIKTNGELQTISIPAYKEREANRAARQVALAPTDTDNAHYPLQLAVLSVNWGGAVAGMRSGSGQANLKTPAGLSSVDFGVSCPVSFQVSPEGRYYRAKWKQDGTELTILMHKLGDASSAAVCDLKTTVHTDVYVRQPSGSLKAVSVEAYNKMQKGEAPPTEGTP